MAYRTLTDTSPAATSTRPSALPTPVALAPAPALNADDLAFLRAVADDTEEAPWMVMGDLQFWSASAFAISLRQYLRAQHVPCFVGAMLPIRYRVEGRRALKTVAPDTLVSFVADHSRSSYNLEREGVFPAFVLEVVSPESVRRDRDEKRRIYGLLGAREYALVEPRESEAGMLEGYRRDGAGQWVRWPLDGQGRLWSRVLGLYLVAEGRLVRAVTGEGLPLLLPDEVETARAREATARMVADADRAREAAGRVAAEAARGQEAAARIEVEVARGQEVAARLEAEIALARETTARVQEAELRVAAERERDRLAEEIARLRRELERPRGGDGDPTV